MSWGPFFVDLPARTYAYSIVYGAGTGRACTWAYEGVFEFQQGRWVALTPRLVNQALGRA
jgi:hypothetical protein